MEVKELFGDEIMTAYNGKYLSRDFGYSCANFNVKKDPLMLMYGGGHDNDRATFDFYTKNPKNVSCIVVFNERDKITGRRMFFRGESMINNEEFVVPAKHGDEIKYLYGYYGDQNRDGYNEIIRYAIKTHGRGVMHTDYGVLENGSMNKDIANFFIMHVENTNFKKYPPIDRLYVSEDLSALSNFRPKRYVIEVLKKDYNKEDIDFHQAYRYEPGKNVFRDHTTWSDFYKID